MLRRTAKREFLALQFILPGGADLLSIEAVLPYCNDELSVLEIVEE